MSLTHRQTNGHVVAQRVVSADDLSKHLENRHFIHARIGSFFRWDNRIVEQLQRFFLFFGGGGGELQRVGVKTVTVETKCDTTSLNRRVLTGNVENLTTT